MTEESIYKIQKNVGRAVSLPLNPADIANELKNKSDLITNFDIPTPFGSFQISLNQGCSIVLLGANGGGKTRLGVKLEQELGRVSEVHRIGAHRSLVMNTGVHPSSYEKSERKLLYGHDLGNFMNRTQSRWQGHPATALLSDFDHLISALYADENEVSVSHRQKHLENSNAVPPLTKLDRLKNIWDLLLPHRKLVVSANNITVTMKGTLSVQYNASELSDGERVIFYLIGQTLLSRPNTILIIDEPELHINRAILLKLWDILESSRSDCTFIYITHDIEFTLSRRSARKFAINSYIKEPKELWDLEEISADIGLSEEVITRVAGSRCPVLFVEGDNSGLDIAFYRCIYDDFTIIPVGSCDAVIHAVSSFKQLEKFHRVQCLGIVDRDGRNNDEIKYLLAKNVHVLSVSEIESVFLLREPFLALAKLQQFDGCEAEAKFNELMEYVIETAKLQASNYAVRATRRQLDCVLKKIGLTSKSINELAQEFTTITTQINPTAIHDLVLKNLEGAINEKDYLKILSLYDNKGVLAEAARILCLKGQKDLEKFICRSLQNKNEVNLLEALKAKLPVIPSSHHKNTLLSNDKNGIAAVRDS